MIMRHAPLYARLEVHVDNRRELNLVQPRRVPRGYSLFLSPVEDVIQWSVACACSVAGGTFPLWPGVQIRKRAMNAAASASPEAAQPPHSCLLTPFCHLH